MSHPVTRLPLLGLLVTISVAGTCAANDPETRYLRGADADLVVLEADPKLDAGNFAKVQYALRAGTAIHEK